ncbi:hypothetical protein FRX31_007208 [Thalictrum thalictroides]|uniref:Peroxisomal and mitochondrial division factor n=1 Tax=Thalictrum thalictroides TaxID=46969 RepID=A0A7J6X2U0_THATH|nr:hypothetical protein FRX31_007208 [Thalictrum thalictroides]
MAEETVINGEETVGTEENKDLIRENEKHKQTIKLLMDEIEGLKTDKAEMKKRLDERLLEEIDSEADKRALGAISSRASELEIEVSRLQHDLGSTMGENDELGTELREMKREFEELKEKEKEKGLKVDELEKEKLELMGKIANEKEEKEKLEEENEKIKGELGKKENEIGMWKKQKEDIESKITLLEEALKKSEVKVGEMELKSNELQSNLEELNQKNLVNGDAVVASKSGNREIGLKGLKVQWPAALVSTGTLAVAAAAAGVYICYAKKR